ncbi:MAG: 50S ribosomal protein L9 [Patescibacteria group bacterium]
MIKIIFLKNTSKVGQTDEIKTVSDGYALNYLVPQGLAEVVNPTKLKLVEQRRAHLAQNQQQLENKWQRWQGVIKNQVIEITAKASSGGKLFAGVTAEQVVNEVNKKFDLQLSVKQLELAGHIKTVGEHEIAVIFSSNYQAKFIFKILPLNND